MAVLWGGAVSYERGTPVPHSGVRGRGPRTPHSCSLSGPVDPSLRALFGRLKFTVRRHKCNKDFLYWGGTQLCGAPIQLCGVASSKVSCVPYHPATQAAGCEVVLVGYQARIGWDIRRTVL